MKKVESQRERLSMDSKLRNVRVIEAERVPNLSRDFFSFCFGRVLEITQGTEIEVVSTVSNKFVTSI